MILKWCCISGIFPQWQPAGWSPSTRKSFRSWTALRSATIRGPDCRKRLPDRKKRKDKTGEVSWQGKETVRVGPVCQEPFPRHDTWRIVLCSILHVEYPSTMENIFINLCGKNVKWKGKIPTPILLPWLPSRGTPYRRATTALSLSLSSPPFLQCLPLLPRLSSSPSSMRNCRETCTRLAVLARGIWGGRTKEELEQGQSLYNGFFWFSFHSVPLSHLSLSPQLHIQRFIAFLGRTQIRRSLPSFLSISYLWNLDFLASYVSHCERNTGPTKESPIRFCDFPV